MKSVCYGFSRTELGRDYICVRNMMKIRPQYMLTSKKKKFTKNARALMVSLVLSSGVRIEKTCID